MQKSKRARAPRTRELVLRHAARGGIAARAGGGVARGQRREPVLHDGHLDQVEAELLDPLHAHSGYVYELQAMLIRVHVHESSENISYVIL